MKLVTIFIIILLDVHSLQPCLEH